MKSLFRFLIAFTMAGFLYAFVAMKMSCGPAFYHDYERIPRSRQDSIEFERWKKYYPREYDQWRWRMMKDSSSLNPKNL